MSDIEIKRTTTSVKDIVTYTDDMLVAIADNSVADKDRNTKAANYEQLRVFIDAVTPATGTTHTGYFLTNLQFDGAGTLQRKFLYTDMDDGLDLVDNEGDGWLDDGVAPTAT